MITHIRRKARERITAFDALVATPHDLGTGPLVLPAAARLALSHTVALSAGQVTITTVAGRRQWSHPALAADAIHRGDWAEADHRVTASGTPLGTLTLHMVNPLDGTLAVIATLIVE